MGARRVAGVAVLVVVGAVPWWGPVALRPFGFFAVHRVVVEGARYLPPATIAAGLGLGPHASVWGNTRRMARRLAAVPGVRSVSIARHLPSSLVVRVVEEEPVALAVGPAGLVPVDDSGRPLPYDPAVTPVDAPVIEQARPRLTEALATIRAVDPGLFADVTTARAAAGAEGDVVVQLQDGQLRLSTPLDPGVVRAVAAVRRDLEARGQRWHELDGRFGGWVVVRRREQRPGPGRPA